MLVPLPAIPLIFGTHFALVSVWSQVKPYSQCDQLNFD